MVLPLWRRPGLAPRDRSIVTVAALIAGNQSVELSHHIGLALDNDVKPRELSEVITHLAFYSGWGNASSAAVAVQVVFLQRGIGKDQLPPATPPAPLKIDEAAEAQRRRAPTVPWSHLSPAPVARGTRTRWGRP